MESACSGEYWEYLRGLMNRKSFITDGGRAARINTNVDFELVNYPRAEVLASDRERKGTGKG